MTEGQKFLHDMAKNNILRSAEKMPEESYAFRSTPEVRSHGQLLGHIAGAQYLFCSAVPGKPNPAPGIEKTKTAKADLIAALKEAFADCGSACAEMMDAKLAEAVKFLGREQTRATVLSFNTDHNNEHYGNIPACLRMKGIVPPSSERR